MVQAATGRFHQIKRRCTRTHVGIIVLHGLARGVIERVGAPVIVPLQAVINLFLRHVRPREGADVHEVGSVPLLIAIVVPLAVQVEGDDVLPLAAEWRIRG